ncbi:MAG TPA: protein phosphatase 2C domain-containing protein, partial [Saprospiraceae bacterium]|nr:protein phosphatase 2C domain-containing protein [Saprospiraceae bacterium]
RSIDGLEWNVKNQKIIGKATTSGDFTLIAYGLFHSDKGYKQKIESSFRLTIIPDPRSLWKNLEPDEKLPYPKSHNDSDSLETEDNNILLFASKRGRSHAHIGTFRDDDGKIVTTPSGWSVLCVADGAGSCSLSREGSKIVTDSATNMLIELLSFQNGNDIETLFLENLDSPSPELEEELQKKLEETIVSASYHALKAIHQKAQDTNQHIKEFSTTLLLTAHKKVERGHIILSFWIGDGVIAIYHKGQKIEILGEPDSGEFAGQTRFLSNDIFNKKSVAKRTSINLVKDFTALILATDGVSDPFFNTDENLKKIEKWDDFWKDFSKNIEISNPEKSSNNILSWLDFWSIGNHDDRSIALLLPEGSNV